MPSLERLGQEEEDALTITTHKQKEQLRHFPRAAGGDDDDDRMFRVILSPSLSLVNVPEWEQKGKFVSFLLVT